MNCVVRHYLQTSVRMGASSMQPAFSRKTPPYTLRVRQSARFASRKFLALSLWFCDGKRADIHLSIINLSDGSPPRKPCKACKNLFHSSCLYNVCLIENCHSAWAQIFFYQWTKTSSSPTGPLCRSEIM